MLCLLLQEDNQITPKNICENCDDIINQNMSYIILIIFTPLYTLIDLNIVYNLHTGNTHAKYSSPV